MNFTIGVQRAEEHATTLKEVAAHLEDDVIDVAAKYLRLIGGLLEQDARDYAPEASGTLKRKIFSELRLNGVALEEIVSVPLVYGAPIEFGRKPGTLPNIPALTRWVEKKLGLAGKDAERRALSIAYAIKQRGFSSLEHDGGKRQQMFQDAWDDNIDRTQRLLDEIGVHVTEAMFERLL